MESGVATILLSERLPSSPAACRRRLKVGMTPSHLTIRPVTRQYGPSFDHQSGDTAQIPVNLSTGAARLDTVRYPTPGSVSFYRVRAGQPASRVSFYIVWNVGARSDRGVMGLRGPPSQLRRRHYLIQARPESAESCKMRRDKRRRLGVRFLTAALVDSILVCAI